MTTNATQLRPRPDQSGYCDCPLCNDWALWADEAEDLIDELSQALEEATGEECPDV